MARLEPYLETWGTSPASPTEGFPMEKNYLLCIYNQYWRGMAEVSQSLRLFTIHSSKIMETLPYLKILEE